MPSSVVAMQPDMKSKPCGQKKTLIAHGEKKGKNGKQIIDVTESSRSLFTMISYNKIKRKQMCGCGDSFRDMRILIFMEIKVNLIFQVLLASTYLSRNLCKLHA